MNIKYSTENGCLEANLTDSNDSDNFYQIASLMEEFGYTFFYKLDDFDSIYWKFKVTEYDFILHFMTFLGVSIMPASGKNASEEENNIVKLVAEKIRHHIK
jgi:hypothetical protein